MSRTQRAKGTLRPLRTTNPAQSYLRWRGRYARGNDGCRVKLYGSHTIDRDGSMAFTCWNNFGGAMRASNKLRRQCDKAHIRMGMEDYAYCQEEARLEWADYDYEDFYDHMDIEEEKFLDYADDWDYPQGLMFDPCDDDYREYY